MSQCACNTYAELELVRDDISKRIKQTRKLKQSLVHLASHTEGEPKLFRCDTCGQLWQENIAWNWGAGAYLFRIPETSVEDWLKDPFVAPDEILIWCAMVDRFLENRTLEADDSKCRTTDCSANAIKMSVFCLAHHIKSLQKQNLFPNTPGGRWFGQYLPLSPENLDRYLAEKQPCRDS